MKKTKQVSLLLHNIRSVQNVGSIFRTADAAGVSKIYLTGYTPSPLDRFGRERTDMKKTALGAEKTIEWEYVKSAGRLIQKFKKENIEVISVEQSTNAIDYKKIKIKSDTVFIFGNEVKGLSKSILDTSDTVAQINMLGKKESLNVSVTAGIFLFRVLSI